MSVLTEAQSPTSAPRRRALRGFKGADVVESEGVRLAASASPFLAAGKVSDHVADGDGVYARRPVPPAPPAWRAVGPRPARPWPARWGSTPPR
ncbi:hypothetical protein [Nonomuraea sp. KM88]|uniref:hypothetical protein n=1 Tax=Nonomuraea sp. KM88 TaxID=3457427 RepID=UPI003FCC5388